MIVKDISVSDIFSSENIRQKYDEKELTSLMQTMKDNGLLQPIGLKEESNNSYNILWGNRRLAAAKKLGWKSIPSVIFANKNESMTEEEFIVINGIENLQQSPNTLYELGRICKILRKTMSISEIAVRLGIPKKRVESAIHEIGRIPSKWQKKVKIMDNRTEEKKGNIPISSAMKIATMKSATASTKDKLFTYMHKNDVSFDMLSIVTSLIQSGKTVEQAVKIAKKYSPLNVLVYCDKAKLDELLKNFNSKVEFAAHVMNKAYPELKAVKNLN